MRLSTTLLLLSVGLATLCCAEPVVRFHRIDRFLRAQYEDDYSDEDITGVQPSPIIPRDPDIPEQDIDKENDEDDDEYYLSRKKRRVIGVAPPVHLPPVENEEAKHEEKSENGRRRRELRYDDDNDDDENEEIIGGTPPPYLPAPTADPLGPLWARLRRRTLPSDDTADESRESDEDHEDVIYRLPRHVRHQRHKRIKKSLGHRTTRCVDGHCSEDSDESRSNEMFMGLKPEDKYDGPLRVRRTLQNDKEEEVLTEDSSKQMDADDEGALRLPRHANQGISVSMPVEEEEGGAHLDPGLGPTDNDDEERKEYTNLLKRIRRHRGRLRHHRQPVHKQKGNVGKSHKAASWSEMGRRLATGKNHW